MAVALVLVVAGTAGAQNPGEVEAPLGVACVNATGDAECFGVAASGTGNATAELVTASGTGDTQSEYGPSVSGTGDAIGRFVAVSGTGDAVAFGLPVALAASGTGDATAYGNYNTVAASATGNATASNGLGPGAAVSLTGDAASGDHNTVVATVTGDAEGMIAVSGTGTADGAIEASLCEALMDATGSSAACHDLDLDLPSP